MPVRPAAPPGLAFGKRSAHVWYVFADGVDEGSLAQMRAEVLAPEEQVRSRAFTESRYYVLSRALVRTVLSRYADVSPRDWTFERNAFGWPAIATPERLGALRFNLSHTRGLVACAVALGCDVGIDVENIERRIRLLTLADRYFSSSEARALRAQPPEARRTRFFEYWTLKESYAKARRMGLALPLGSFSFHLEDDRGIRAAFDPELCDDPGTWQFALFRPTPRHVMAISVRRVPGANVQIQWRQAGPHLGP